MSASRDDVSITVISNNEKFHYCSFKDVSYLLWDIRFGLYSDSKPDAKNIFKFAKKGN